VIVLDGEEGEQMPGEEEEEEEDLEVRRKAVFRIHRIHMFLGLPDPDPLVRGMDPDPDPDPSIIMQK
jgi:hypothetical protein